MVRAPQLQISFQRLALIDIIANHTDNKQQRHYYYYYYYYYDYYDYPYY